MLRNAMGRWDEEKMRYTLDWEDADGNLRSLELTEDNLIPPQVLYVNLVQVIEDADLEAHTQVLDYAYGDRAYQPTLEEGSDVRSEPVAPDGESELRTDYVKVAGPRDFVEEQTANFQEMRTERLEPESPPEPELELEPEPEPEPESEPEPEPELGKELKAIGSDFIPGETEPVDMTEVDPSKDSGPF